MTLSAESLHQSAARLLQTGSGGLIWSRLRHSELKNSRFARVFHQAYRLNVIETARKEEQLPRALDVLRAAGIEPILLKGWAVARIYPEPGLRPYGDHDLAVPTGRLAEALEALSTAAGGFPDVDLHEGIPDLPGRSWSELFSRSRLEPLGQCAVRVLSAEDQLCLLAFHFIRHGGWRPVWLCDIAAILESLPARFDWDYCLSGHPLASAWVIHVIELAKQLLDARPVTQPLWNQIEPLPGWLPAAVQWRWTVGFERPSLAYYLRHPVEIVRTYAYHWLDPIKATLRLRIKPRRSLVLMHLLAFLGRPILAMARLRRLTEKRLHPALLPCAVHRDSVF